MEKEAEEQRTSQLTLVPAAQVVGGEKEEIKI
jgi:hypothetical protein